MADDPGAAPTPRPRRRRAGGSKAKAGPAATPAESTPPAPDAAVPDDGGSQDPGEAERPIEPRLWPPEESARIEALADAEASAEAEADAEHQARLAFTVGAATTPRHHDIPHEPWLPLLEGRSPNPEVCPFLRAVEDDEEDLGSPIEAPDPANRCAAMRDAVPQSLRQQELVCLTSGHVNCPRYLRGAVVVTEVPVAAVRSGPTIRPAVLASILVLVAAFTASVGFVVARGGITLPSAAVIATATPAPSSTALAVASLAPASPAATAASSVVPSPSVLASATPAATATPVPTATPTPAPTATATPAPTPEPTVKPTKKPTSARYALLEPCPNKPKCWIYTIRSGDNLFSIANYFGIPLSTVKRLNPWTETSRLKAGQHLILPPPTR